MFLLRSHLTLGTLSLIVALFSAAAAFGESTSLESRFKFYEGQIGASQEKEQVCLKGAESNVAQLDCLQDSAKQVDLLQGQIANEAVERWTASLGPTDKKRREQELRKQMATAQEKFDSFSAAECKLRALSERGTSSGEQMLLLSCKADLSRQRAGQLAQSLLL